MTQAERDRLSKLNAAMWTAVAMALTVALVTGVATWQWQQSREAALRSDQVMNAANAVLADLTDMETGQRAYILVGEANFLQPFNAGRERLERDTTALVTIMARAQNDTIALQIADLAARKHVEMNKGVAFVDARQRDSAMALVRAGRGKAIMDSVRIAIASINTMQHDSVDAHRQAEATWATIARVVLVAGTLLMIAVLFSLRRALGRYDAEQTEFRREMERQLRELETQSRRLADGGLATQ